MTLNKLKVVIWKELLDTIRDYPMLITAAILPLLLLPLMGFVSVGLRAQQQQPLITICLEDNSTGMVNGSILTAETFADELAGIIERYGSSVIKSCSVIGDVRVEIKKGFIANLTSLKNQAGLILYRVPGSVRADQAFQIAFSAAVELSVKYSKLKISLLSERARIRVNPDAIRDPIVVREIRYMMPSGAPTTPEFAIKAELARLLTFSLLFVMSPAVTYISDSIVGEKERRTLESLLVLPIKHSTIILGKLFSCSIVGLVAALADALGLLLMVASFGGAWFLGAIDWGLIAIHALTVYLTVITSLALALPVIVRSTSFRSAQVSSFTVLGIASAIFFSTLFVDIVALRSPIKEILYIIPYTHAALIIRNYVFGELINVFIHIIIILGIVVALISLSAAIFDPERAIYGRTRAE